MADMTIEEVKEKVSKGLEVARWKLLDQFPFTGEMALRFQIVPTYDCRIDTAATDGTKVYFDCEFYSKLTEGQRSFVLAHEIWHNIFLHFKRIGTRERGLWNVATDCEINHMLKNEGLEPFPDGCFPDPEVAGESAEDIYAYLQKKQNQQQKNQKNNQQSQSNGGSGNGGGSSSDDGDDSSSQNKSSSNGNSGKDSNDKKNGSSSSSQSNNENGNQFDKHFYEGCNAGEGEKKDGKWGEKGYDSDYNPSLSDAREVEDKIKEAVVSAAQSIERNQGHLPGAVSEIVKEMLKPEINWKEALSQFVTKCLGGEHSWKRISRHALCRGHYLPGQTDEKIKCAVCVDTSGSCLQDIPKFLGELDALLKSFGKYEITLVQCDADVQSVEHYTENDVFDAKEFKVRGCGGTSFKPFFKYLRENGDDYNCVLYLTDGWGDAPKFPPPYPVLWVLTSGGCTDFCDWGEKMMFKPSKER